MIIPMDIPLHPDPFPIHRTMTSSGTIAWMRPAMTKAASIIRVEASIVLLKKVLGFSLGIIRFIQCKPRLLRRAQSRWGFQRGEAAALPIGPTRGFKPRVRYNLITTGRYLFGPLGRYFPMSNNKAFGQERMGEACHTRWESAISQIRLAGNFDDVFDNRTHIR